MSKYSFYIFSEKGAYIFKSIAEDFKKIVANEIFIEINKNEMLLYNLSTSENIYYKVKLKKKNFNKFEYNCKDENKIIKISFESFSLETKTIRINDDIGFYMRENDKENLCVEIIKADANKDSKENPVTDEIPTICDYEEAPEYDPPEYDTKSPIVTLTVAKFKSGCADITFTGADIHFKAQSKGICLTTAKQEKTIKRSLPLGEWKKDEENIYSRKFACDQIKNLGKTGIGKGTIKIYIIDDDQPLWIKTEAGHLGSKNIYLISKKKEE